jgi:hypothetical protein
VFLKTLEHERVKELKAKERKAAKRRAKRSNQKARQLSLARSSSPAHSEAESPTQEQAEFHIDRDAEQTAAAEDEADIAVLLRSPCAPLSPIISTPVGSPELETGELCLG